MSLNVLGKAVASGTVLSATNAIIGGGTFMTLGPVQKGRYATQTSQGSDGFTIMHPSAMQVDGDLVFGADWAYAAGHVSRINNNGTITRLYTDAYTNYSNLGVNKVRKKFYIGNMSLNSAQEYDYSNAAGGGSTVTKGTLWNAGNTSVPTFACGYWYWSGWYVCGDYMYLCRQNDYPGTEVVERWNTYTNTYSTISIVRGHGGRIYNGGFTYDPDTDRLYQAGISGDGGIYVIVDASTAGATAYQVTTSSSVANNIKPDIYVNGDIVVAWGYGSGYTGKLDITNCLKGVGAQGATATPTTVWLNTSGLYGAGWVGIHGCYKPEGLDMALAIPDRGIARMGGWIDLDNGTVVGSPTTPYYSTARPYMSDYSANWKRVTTANSTKYWVFSSYYEDYGPYLRTLPDDTGPRLENSWELQFGPYSFSPAANIAAVTITADGATTPTGCTLTFYISCDAGSTWQTITPGVPTDCNVIGTAIRVRIAGTGTNTRSSYVKTVGAMVIALSDQPTGFTPALAQRFRLAGVS